MKTLLEFMNEAGKTKSEITWTKDINWLGYFRIDDVKFEIHIKKTDYCENVDVYEFKFYRENSSQMFNDYKYPYSVVPTIQYAMETFLEEVHPEVIGFVGNKDDKGRIKMYEKNSKIYSDKFHYKLHLDKTTDYFAFILYTSNELESCVKELESSKL